MSKYFFRKIYLLMVYFCLTGFLIWYFFPLADESRRERIEGIPFKVKTEGRSSKATFGIGDVVFSCAASPLGHGYTCPTSFDSNAVAVATYFRMPTLLTKIFSDPNVPVLMRLEQNKRTLIAYGFPDVLDDYRRSSVFMALYLALPFFMIFRLSLFRRQNGKKK